MIVPSRRLSSARDRSRRLRRAGFTIVELMVAAAITLVVLGFMVQITFSTLQTFDKVSGTLTSKSQAQLVFDYLRRDFSTLVWRRDGNVWLLATVQPDQTNINSGQGDAKIGDADWKPTNPKPGVKTAGDPDSSLRLERPGAATPAKRLQPISDYRFGQAGVWLRFFTNQLTADTSQPAPIAVAYQIVRIKPQLQSTTREMRYWLFRSAVRPAPTDSTTRSVLNAGFDLTDNTANGYNENTSTNSGIGEPGGIREPDRKLLLANNVVDFGVRFWKRNPANGQEQLIFPADTSNHADNDNLGYAITTRLPADVTATGGSSSTIPFGTNLSDVNFQTAAEAEGGYPDYAEVMIRVLTEEGALLIAEYESGDSIPPSATGTPTQTEKDTYWWTLAETHSVVYTDRIPIVARPF
jgi:type II secretory pathway pseudopilin PulG